MDCTAIARIVRRRHARQRGGVRVERGNASLFWTGSQVSEPIDEFVRHFIARFGSQARSIALSQAALAADLGGSVADTWTRIAERIGTDDAATGHGAPSDCCPLD